MLLIMMFQVSTFSSFRFEFTQNRHKCIQFFSAKMKNTDKIEEMSENMTNVVVDYEETYEQAIVQPCLQVCRDSLFCTDVAKDPKQASERAHSSKFSRMIIQSASFCPPWQSIRRS